MSSLLEEIMSGMDAGTLTQLGQQAGIDSSAVSGAVQAALPAILGGLTKNASQQGGAEALSRALQKDHGGGVMGGLGGLLQNQDLMNQGQKILGHVFGKNETNVARGLGQVSNQPSGSMTQLMALLAPMVMGMLGEKQQKQNLDSSSLSEMLGQEKQKYASAQPQATDFLSSLLDADGDGDVDVSDLLSKAPGLLNKFFGK